MSNGYYSPLKEGLVAPGKHTAARPGDRTVVDALAPLGESVTSITNTTWNLELEVVVKTVKQEAESTRGIRAKLGRASYVTGDMAKFHRTQEHGGGSCGGSVCRWPVTDCCFINSVF